MNESDSLDCIVVGAGVIGLAVARRLALDGEDVAVVEAESAIGTHTSSRNSEVIHAGIYYPRGSLKARLCVAGREALYAYCRDRNVPHRRLGKLIVAGTEADWPKIEALLARGRDNGVDDLREVSGTESRALEPAVTSVGGLLSPSTGIVDSHALMTALQSDLESAGGHVVVNSPVVGIDVAGAGFRVRIGGDTGATIDCRLLVNAAGLDATSLAGRIDGLERVHVPELRYAKGHYFAFAGRSPFSRLVYPLPDDGGLGIHATLDMGNRLRFGPDVDWHSGRSYAFDDSRKPAFVASIRRYYPALDADRLVPDYTGIRPKLSGPGEPAADFSLQDASVHGIAGLINLYGIESPGLTCCLALADLVRNRLQAFSE